MKNVFLDILSYINNKENSWVKIHNHINIFISNNLNYKDFEKSNIKTELINLFKKSNCTSDFKNLIDINKYNIVFFSENTLIEFFKNEKDIKIILLKYNYEK